MGKKASTISGLAGLGSLLAGVGAPKVIEGLPPWVNIALLAGGAALILAAFISHMLTFKKDNSAAANTTAATTGPSSPALAGTFRDVHIYPTPAAIQERQQAPPTVRGSRPPSGQRGPMPALVPDLPLNGFLGRVYKALGGSPSDPSKLPDFYRRVDLAILDAITERHLHVWGRQGNHGRGLIPRQDIEHAAFNHRTGALSSYRGITVYRDLKFVAAEIENIWPKPLETTNDGRP